MQPFTTSCAQCGRDFSAARSDARYCSSSCRAAARRARDDADALAWVDMLLTACERGDLDALDAVDRRGVELFGDQYDPGTIRAHAAVGAG